jgi:hypothetical protein
MQRMERTEIFGRHIISATACSARGGGSWQVDVAAVVLGKETDAPLVRFSPPMRIPEDPNAALEAALEGARRELVLSET